MHVIDNLTQSAADWLQTNSGLLPFYQHLDAPKLLFKNWVVADLVYEAIISKANRKFIVYGHSNFGPALHFLVHFEINFNLLSKIILSKLICHCSDILYLMYCIYKMWSHVRLQLFRALAIKTKRKKEKSSRVLTDRETLFVCLWRVFNLESVKSVKTLEERNFFWHCKCYMD